eukprot:COSAG01_NODE_1938_length_8848_cov_17.798377_4_plen_154_part_00
MGRARSKAAGSLSQLGDDRELAAAMQAAAPHLEQCMGGVDKGLDALMELLGEEATPDEATELCMNMVVTEVGVCLAALQDGWTSEGLGLQAASDARVQAAMVAAQVPGAARTAPQSTRRHASSTAPKAGAVAADCGGCVVGGSLAVGSCTSAG